MQGGGGEMAAHRGNYAPPEHAKMQFYACHALTTKAAKAGRALSYAQLGHNSCGLGEHQKTEGCFKGRGRVLCLGLGLSKDKGKFLCGLARNGNLWLALFTHPLIGAIGAVRITVADPPLGDAGSIRAGVLRHGVAGHHWALLLVGSIAAVVVVVALPSLLDAPSIAAGELVGTTGLVCEFIKNI